MLFLRMVRLLDEEIKDGNKWISFYARNGVDGFFGCVLWLVIMLPLFMLLPEDFPYFGFVWSIWLALLVFALVLRCVMRRKYVKGFHKETEPGRLTDEAVKIMTYIICVIPVYLMISFLLTALVFVLYNIFQGKC